MKTIVFVLCLLSATGAFAQYNLGGNTINNQPMVYQFPSHPGHASYAPLSQEQSILGGAPYMSAQGERRPSDFAQPDEVSLGAVARELKKQHSALKKSRVVWINQ
ncbi:MAG: hypothetical protein WAM89_13990 [Terriglobales bacterium]